MMEQRHVFLSLSIICVTMLVSTRSLGMKDDHGSHEHKHGHASDKKKHVDSDDDSFSMSESYEDSEEKGGGKHDHKDGDKHKEKHGHDEDSHRPDEDDVTLEHGKHGDLYHNQGFDYSEGDSKERVHAKEPNDKVVDFDHKDNLNVHIDDEHGHGDDTRGHQDNTSSSTFRYDSYGQQRIGPAGANLFVYNLPPDFREPDLRTMFHPFGEVLSAKVIMNKMIGISKGYGFISFVNADSAKAAMFSLHRSRVANRTIGVEPSKYTNEEASNRDVPQQPAYGTSSYREGSDRNVNNHRGPMGANLYVNFLPLDYTEQDLHDLFSKYGKVVSTKIMLNLDTMKSRGFGFVSFEDPVCAQEAIKGLDRLQLGNKRLIVQLKRSFVRHNRPSRSWYNTY